MANITKTLYVSNRKDWRKWLAAHYESEPEIWLIYYKQKSGKQRIPYNDAVEEALCFGWIDSTVKGIDDEKYAQRFSPRKTKTTYSQTNKERLRVLLSQGKVIKTVRDSLPESLLKISKMPEDILMAIHANKQAWHNFQIFSDRYKRIRISFIEDARDRPEEFQKRLAHFIKMTAANKQFGFNIKDYYD